MIKINFMIKQFLIFFISLSTSSFSKDSKFEKKLKKDIKKLSKFNGFIDDKDPYENSETLHFFLNKNKIKIINYTNFKCKNKFGANAHAFPTYPKNDNCFAQWENKNQYIINYLKEVFKS